MNDSVNDELLTCFNELESKVLILLETVKDLTLRVKTLENIATSNGIDVNENRVEADQCTIN